MTKWEYKVITVSENEVEINLDKLGEQDWELVAIKYKNIYGMTLYLKRPNEYPILGVGSW